MGLVPRILKDSKCKKNRTVEQIFLFGPPVLAQSFLKQSDINIILLFIWIISRVIILGRAICPITISGVDHRGLSVRIMSMDQIRKGHTEGSLRSSKASTVIMDQCHDFLRKRQGRQHFLATIEYMRIVRQRDQRFIRMRLVTDGHRYLM